MQNKEGKYRRCVLVFILLSGAIGGTVEQDQAGAQADLHAIG